MADDDALVRAGPDSFRGPAHASPYPTSRLAPVHELVDPAAEIARADATLGLAVTARLEEIAGQIRALQRRAAAIVEEARGHAELHRARCRFRRKPGKTYHLYRDGSGDYFSLLSPVDWRGEPPHAYVGSYRLESDMRWTRVDLDASDMR